MWTSQAWCGTRCAISTERCTTWKSHSLDRQAAARSPAVATGLMNIASVLLTRGQHQWALAYLNEAIDIDRRSAPLDPVLSDRHAICRHRSTIRCRSACSGLSSCTQNAVTRT